MDRALPLAVWITTVQTTVGLFASTVGIEFAVDLGVFLDTHFDGFFFRVVTFDF